MLTKEEVQNIVILLNAGARAVANNEQLEQAGAVLNTAAALIKKVQSLVPKDEPVEVPVEEAK